jgi:hypothetical protein
MTENEAKIFIQNAMEQSKNVLAELMLIMPKVFAAKRKSLGEYYSNLENCKKEIQSCEVAIKALEEVQRWHTSVINPNIKNEFANTSTQICHNCDHKDEYIEELEAEVEEYRAIGTPEELQEMKKDFAEALSDWRQYRKVGTLEECRAAVEKQTAKRPRIMGNAMICPSCPRCFKSDNSAYCPSCGQKLKWEDEE